MAYTGRFRTVCKLSLCWTSFDFGLLHHSYADATQIYIKIKKQNCFADKLSDIEDCVSKIMDGTLNSDKNEFFMYGCNVKMFDGGAYGWGVLQSKLVINLQIYFI